MEFQAVSGPKFTRLFSSNAGRIAIVVTSSDFGYLQPFLRYSRSKSEVVQNWPKFCMFLAPNLLGDGPPNFWSQFIKFSQIPTMWQSFRAIGRGSSEHPWRNKKKHLGQNVSPSGTTVPGGLNSKRLSVLNGDRNEAYYVIALFSKSCSLLPQNLILLFMIVRHFL